MLVRPLPASVAVLAGIEAALGAGEHALTSSSGDDPARELELLRAMLRHRVDGLVITPCAEVSGEVERIAASGTPATSSSAGSVAPPRHVNCWPWTPRPKPSSAAA